MSTVKINHPTKNLDVHIKIPGSKSESNRLLILNALSNRQIKIENLSTARDTQHLISILSSNQKEIDVLDAGTSMRFLTAFYCASNQHKIVTGSERMKQRPIAPLVSALSEMGFNINYKEQPGFLPVEVLPVTLEKIEAETFIEGNTSSQFITALLLIAPFLPKGLKINFTTELTSKPYVDMTLKILGHLGVKYEWSENSISIAHSPINTQKSYAIGPDWSSASYWYSMAFLADKAKILLEGLKNDWTQGDRIIMDWMKRFGVITTFSEKGALLEKIPTSYPHMMKMNFRDNPDLAQTFAVMFAAKNIYATFSGIESLKIKETDRVTALKNELQKLNVRFDYSEMYEFYQLKGEFKMTTTPISTYNDHRMAMSFAPLGLLNEIEIENPEVVEKSYPEFWNDLRKAGFEVKR